MAGAGHERGPGGAARGGAAPRPRPAGAGRQLSASRAGRTQERPLRPGADNGGAPDPGAAPTVGRRGSRLRRPARTHLGRRLGAARARGLRTARRARPFISRFVCPRRPSRRPGPAARDAAGRCAPPRAPRGAEAGLGGAGLLRAGAVPSHLPRPGQEARRSQAPQRGRGLGGCAGAVPRSNPRSGRQTTQAQFFALAPPLGAPRADQGGAVPRARPASGSLQETTQAQSSGG